MTEPPEQPTLPQARMYWKSAQWGFEALLQEKLSGYGYRFFLIGILAALRAVQHSLNAHDRNLSPRHKEVISEWWKKTADDTKIPDLRFIKNARNLILKDGSFSSYAGHTDTGTGEGANYRVIRTDYELWYYDENDDRQDLEATLRSAIDWCDRELSEIERQIG
jgi:hypothetical protein